MYVLFAGYPPFTGKSDKDICDKIQNKQVIYDSHDFSHLSSPGLAFLKRMLTKNPEERISASDALQDEWFTSNNAIDINDEDISSNLSNLKNFRV